MTKNELRNKHWISSCKAGKTGHTKSWDRKYITTDKLLAKEKKKRERETKSEQLNERENIHDGESKQGNSLEAEVQTLIYKGTYWIDFTYSSITF